MITCPSFVGQHRRTRAADRLAAPACSSSSSSRGVAAIDSVTATASRSATGRSSTPAAVPAANSTKANSPPCDEHERRAAAPARRPAQPAPEQIEDAALTTTRPDHDGDHEVRPLDDQAEVDRHAHGDEEQAQQQALERARCRPRSRGGTRNSASSTPAMKAPSATDSPACSITSATPTTVSRARRRHGLACTRVRGDEADDSRRAG